MRSVFTVVLEPKTDKNSNAYFTPQNEIVGAATRGVWYDFKEASKAAQRARLQDTLGRRVTVREY